MTLQEIRGRFQQALREDPAGELRLDAGLLAACGVNSGMVSPLPGGTLRLRAPVFGEVNGGAFALEGDADLLGEASLRLRGEVREAPGGARAVLRAALDEDWSFRRALPGLPPEFDPAPGADGLLLRDSLLYTLGITEPRVALASFRDEDAAAGQLDPGLNLSARVGLNGPLAFLRGWGIAAEEAAVAGMVDLSGAQPRVILSLRLPLDFRAGPVTLGDAWLGIFCLPGEEDAPPLVGMEVDLTAGLGEARVQLRTVLEPGSSRLALSGEFAGMGIAGLARLAADLGVPDLAAVLPPGLAELPLPELRHARVVVDVEAGTLEEVELGLASPAPWPLVAGITLQGLGFALQVERPLAADRAVSAEATGRFGLADGAVLAVRGAYPGFAVSGGLEPGAPLSLNHLLAAPGLHLPPVSIPGDPVVQELGFMAAPRTGDYAFHVEVDGDWPLPLPLPAGAELSLGAVVLAMGYAGGRASGRVAGTFDALGAPLVVSAELPAEGGAGVVLEGGTLPGAEVSARQLAGSLLSALNLPAPPLAGDILFRDVRVRVDTRAASRAFVLNGESSLATPLHLPGGDAPLSLSLGLRDVGYDFAAERFAGRFEGTVAFDDARFTTVVDVGEQERSVTFTQGGEALDLTRVLARLVPGGVDLPAELPGIDGLKVSGIAGSMNLQTRAWSFAGTASVERFAAGGVTVEGAHGTVEIRGAGGALESFSVTVAADSLRQPLVPDLQVDALSLELSLARVDAGWRWNVGGAVTVRLLDLAPLTLRADASNEALAFAAEAAPELEWWLGGVASGTFRRVSMRLHRDAPTGAVEWKLEAAGALQAAQLPRLSGTLGLFWEADRRGFAFTADEGQEPLSIEIPLVPGMERMTVGGSFLLRELSILRRAEWEISAASQLRLRVPRPASPASDDPVDQALTLLNDMLGQPVDAVLTVSGTGARLVAEHLPRIPVPVPVLSGGELVMDRMGRVGLDRLEVRLGASFAVEGVLALSVPEEINNVFGERDGHPVHPLINREFRLGISVDSRLGLGLELGSSPLDLNAAGIFREEREQTDRGTRVWTRVTLGPLSFRFGEFADAVEAGKKWWHFDFGDFGEIAFLKPRLSFNGASFAASGGFHVIRDLRLPLRPLASALRGMRMTALADALPPWLPLLDIHLLHDDGAGGKRFHADDLADLLERIRADTGLAVPVRELRPVLRLLGDRFNQLPSAFRDYLDVTIPRRFEFDLAVTPGTGFGVKFDIRAPENPVRLLLPTPSGFEGITLRKLALGELLSGSLLQVEASVELDSFDVVSLAASVFLPEEVSRTFTDTRSIHRRLVLHDVTVLVILASGVPIPVPVWFSQVGVQYHGLEGVRAGLLVNNNLADLTLVSALRGLVDVYRELKRFFSEADRLLPDDLFARNGLNAGINVTPGFVQLPRYLDGAVVGSEQTLFTLGVDQVLVAVANFIKRPEIGKILALVPLEYRNGVLGGTDQGVSFGPFRVRAAWLFSTLQELDGLVGEPPERRGAFVRSLERGGGGENVLVREMRGIVSQAAGGEAHDGVVLYLAGGVEMDVPGAPASLEAYGGLVVDRARGVLTAFRVTGAVGGLVAVDVGGVLAARVLRPADGGNPTAELLLEGHARLDVLGHRAVDASIGLRDGVFTFHDRLSLFPPGFGYQLDAEVAGEIGRDRLWVHGSATAVLPLLPVTSTRFELTYGRALLMGSWMGQEWELEVARLAADRYRFRAEGVTPLALIPGLVEVTAAEVSTRGPVLELTGPASPSLLLDGAVSLPRLAAYGAGRVYVGADSVRVNLDARFLDRFQARLAVTGDALDRPASLAFRAEFQGDLFHTLVDGLKAGFDQVMADARALLADAKAVFDREWARFTRLVEEGYHAVRAGLLQARQQVEEIIQSVNAQVDAVLGLLRVNDDEREARRRWISEANNRVQAGLRWFQDQVEAARHGLEGRRGELARLDADYARKNDWDKFWGWAEYQITRLRLLVETEVLPRILWVAEQALEQARNATPFVAAAVDVVLQELDRVRNSLYDELQRHKQYLLDRKAELDHFNQLLTLRADDLLREFGRTVDTTVRDAAQKAYDAAQGVVAGLERAGENAARLAHGAVPFEVDRLAISGALGTASGTRFTAEADIWFNVFEQRRMATNVGFALDFNDVAGSAGALAAQLWDKRDEIQYLDEWEVRRREAMRPLDAGVESLRAMMAAVGPDFGESMEKKVLYDMDWMELVHFYQFAREQLERFPVLAQVVAVVERDYGTYIRAVVTALTSDSPWASFVRDAAVAELRRAEAAYKSRFGQQVLVNQELIDAARARAAELFGGPV